MNTNPNAKTILCFGDSNTWGQKPDKSGRYAADVRWTGLLQQRLGSDYYVIEEGLGSRTTNLEHDRKPGRNGKEYFGPCLESHLPLDMVVMMLGTNDLKIQFHRSASEIADAVADLAAMVATKCGEHTKLLLVSPIIINDTAPCFSEYYAEYYNHESAEKSLLLAAEIQRVATRLGCAYADASQVSQAGEDGIHFSQEAHENLAQLLFEKIKNI